MWPEYLALATPADPVAMPVERKPDAQPSPSDTVEVARSLVRSASKGVLATLDAGSGAPYASLVLVATTASGAPIFLLSRLALHTRNIAADARVSLLIDGTGGAGDPMTGARISLSGTLAMTVDPDVRRWFLARHPTASGYADFADFAFFALAIKTAHMIQGFGRITDIAGLALLDERAPG